MSGTLKFTLAASGEQSRRVFKYAGGHMTCTEGPPPGKEVDLLFDDMQTPYRMRKALEYYREFECLEIVNTTGEVQTFELQISSVGDKVIDRSYVGQELSLQGDLYVPGAPSIDQGGSVLEIGDSSSQQIVDMTGLPDGPTEVITAAMNTGGVRVRYIELILKNIGASALTRGFRVFSPGVRNYRVYFWNAAEHNNTIVGLYDQFDLPPNAVLDLYLRTDDNIEYVIAYDNL